MTTRANRELIDRLLSRFANDGQPPHVLERIEAQLREAAESVGESDQFVRLDDINATVRLHGRGPTLAQRVRRALA